MHVRTYMIFNVSEVNTIDFNETVESHLNDLLLSVDETKTYVKWESDTVPTSINNLTTKEGPYTHTEILHILKNTPEWNPDL